nr:hypothetical protein [Gemmatimonadales bacterium]
MPAGFSVSLVLLALIALAQIPTTALAQDTVPASRHSSAPQIRAARVQGDVTIDGHLDEPSWIAAEPATGFTQTDPNEGKPATERTEVRVLIGDDALYIGARLHDREPGQVKAALA